MRDILRRYKPDTVEDLTALNALYRPGPIGRMIDDFIERKRGRETVEFDLPELEGILKDTLGVIVYQEQVMQIANVLASYSLGEADLLRRAMGKKNPEAMAKQRDRFMSGAAKLGFRRIESPRSSSRWQNSPATDSTSRTPPPTRFWPIRPLI